MDIDDEDEDDDISIDSQHTYIAKPSSDFDYRFVLELVYADGFNNINEYIENACIPIGETIYDIFDSNIIITDFKITFMFDFQPNCDACKTIGDNIYVMYPSNKSVWTTQPYVTIDFDAKFRSAKYVFRLINLLSTKVDCGQHENVYAQSINCANWHTKQNNSKCRIPQTKNKIYLDGTNTNNSTTKRCAVVNIANIILPAEKHMMLKWRRYCKFDNKDNMIARRIEGYGRGKVRLKKLQQFIPTAEYFENIKNFGNVNYAFNDIVVIFDFVNSYTKSVVDQQKNNNIDRTCEIMKDFVEENDLVAYKVVYILKKNENTRYVSCIITFDDTIYYKNTECDVVISFHMNFEKYLRNGNYDMCARFLSLINHDDVNGFIDLLERKGLSFSPNDVEALKRYLTEHNVY